jgi:type IV pilus assembly protein PilN
MILINLLPHREVARRKRKERFYVQLVLSALLGGLLCAAVYGGYQGRLSHQRQRNAFLRAEIARLDEQIKDVATLQTEIAALQARQTAVENLQSDRNLPVHLLEALVTSLPDGVYLRGVRQEARSVVLVGSAQTQERVSELLRQLGQGSAWLGKPELVEIVAARLDPRAMDQRRVSNFTIRVELVRPSPASEPVSAKGKG